MNDPVSKLHPCAHCRGEGTCNTGKEGTSCEVCRNNNDLKRGEYFGLACGVCNGLGVAESKTDRLNNRLQPVLALLIIYTALVFILIFGIAKSPYFNEVLAFCSTLVGGVTGYYFCSREKGSGY